MKPTVVIVVLALSGCGGPPHYADLSNDQQQQNNEDEDAGLPTGDAGGYLTLAQDNWGCYDGSFLDGNGFTHDHPICGVDANIYCLRARYSHGLFLVEPPIAQVVMICDDNSTYNGPQVGHDAFYAPLVFPQTTCDPADPQTSCTAQLQDWCEYDSPAYPNLIASEPQDRRDINMYNLSTRNPLDGGWSGTLTGNVCVPLGVGDGG